MVVFLFLVFGHMCQSVRRNPCGVQVLGVNKMILWTNENFMRRQMAMSPAKNQMFCIQPALANRHRPMEKRKERV